MIRKVRILWVIKGVNESSNFLGKYVFIEVAMNKYFCLTMEERINRIGELLAKGTYLYFKGKKEKESEDEKKSEE